MLYFMPAVLWVQLKDWITHDGNSTMTMDTEIGKLKNFLSSVTQPHHTLTQTKQHTTRICT